MGCRERRRCARLSLNGLAACADAFAGLSNCLVRFADALIPCGCAICRAAIPADGPPLCGLCASRVASVPTPWCPRCGLTRVIPGPAVGQCSECHSWSPALRRAASACLYVGPAAELVRGFKYRAWTRLAEFMGDLMLAPARRLVNGSVPELVPVPLTKAKRRERGFNQAELLAQEMSRRSGWPVALHLSRERGGPPLARLGRWDRAKVARRAYSIRSGAAGLAGPRSAVLIVDDVITTGATGVACAEALDAVGLECLGIVSFARTSPLVGGG